MLKSKTYVYSLIIGLSLTSQLVLSADDTQNSETPQFLNSEFFNKSKHWSVNDEGDVFFTHSEITASLEDKSTQLLTRDHLRDVLVKFDFKLDQNSDIDVMFMARYPLRLSTNSNAIGLEATGSIAKSWDHYNKDNPTRLFGGFTPVETVQLTANEWHSFEAEFRAPRYDEAHNKVSQAFLLEARINGKVVQQNIIIPLPSKNAWRHWEGEAGPMAIDAINGKATIAKVMIARADFGRVELPENSRGENNQADLVDLVSQGKSAFKNYGCAECHSVSETNTAVKSGPRLYGLFTRDARKRWVQNQEGHKYEVRADANYMVRSIRNADAELAIAEEGAKEGEAYLGIMPRYNTQIMPDKDISAIFAYLKTRNNLWQQGPIVQLENAEGPQVYDPMQDPMQFVVQDRIRIQRGPLKEVSGRAIHVGHPNGIHYTFDPRKLAVSKVWQGGFLETSGELTGRGGKAFDLGFGAVEVTFGEHDALIQAINPAGNRVDFSFKEPKYEDNETLKKSAYSTRSFEERIAEQNARFKGYYRDSSQPLSPVSFFYDVGDNSLELTHSFSTEGKLIIEISGNLNSPQKFAVNQDVMKNIELTSGQLKDGIWTIEQGQNIKASLSAEITLVDTPWQATLNQFNYEKQELSTRPAVADLPPGYSIESWEGPKDNAGRDQLFEAIGLDTVINGDILVSTRTAGVWRIRNGQWQLFGEGIFDSLGILSESENGDTAIVGNKAELTRLRDVNGDGIADYFDTVFDSFTNGSNYHAYMHGPVKDANGDYIIAMNLAHGKGVAFTAGGNVMGSHGGYVGWAFKIKPNGEFEKFANGLRSPAGLGVDPSGNIWYADNQGDFVGSSKIFKLEKGNFYGHPAGLIDEPNMTPDSEEVKWESIIDRKALAAIVVAHGHVANSLGNLVWDTTEGGFGQFAGNALIGDQTQSNLSRVTFEKVGEYWQGAMMPFAKGMESGVMRPIYLPDNSLLLGQTGRGWQAKGGNAAALQRIVYDGETKHLAIKETSITEEGFILSMSSSLPQQLSKAELLTWISIESWTYRDAPNYGSEELGVEQNEIENIDISTDRKSVRITLKNPSIPKVHPQQTGRIFHIKLEDESLKSLAGTNSMDAYYSAHRFR